MVSDNAPIPKQSVKLEIAEHIGDLFDKTGNQHMAGRVFGWLLVSGEPHQSQPELSQALQVSKGAISQATRLLIELGLLKSTRVPGYRCRYYRIAPDAWRRLVSQYLGRIRAAREIAQNGLAKMSGLRAEDKVGLERMLQLTEFLEDQGSVVLRQWPESHNTK